MTILDAIIQGIVQGLTEFLPVSSSGHLMISQHILGIRENNLFFDIILHLGTLLAVFSVYYKLVIRLIKAFFELIGDIFARKFKWKELHGDKRLVIMLIIGLLPLFLLFLPVPGTGLNIKDLAQNLMESSSLFVVSLSLLTTSILLFLGILNTRGQRFDSKLPGVKKEYGVLDSIYVGFAQLIAAVFPGLSRSGSTLSAGLFRGINKQHALDYSFVLGIPAILAASMLEFKTVIEAGTVKIEFLPVLVGFMVSAVVGFLSIKLFRWLLKTDKMMIFVVYTLIVGLITLVISFMEFKSGVNLFTGVRI